MFNQKTAFGNHTNCHIIHPFVLPHIKLFYQPSNGYRYQFTLPLLPNKKNYQTSICPIRYRIVLSDIKLSYQTSNCLTRHQTVLSDIKMSYQTLNCIRYQLSYYDFRHKGEVNTRPMWLTIWTERRQTEKSVNSVESSVLKSNLTNLKETKVWCQTPDRHRSDNGVITRCNNNGITVITTVLHRCNNNGIIALSSFDLTKSTIFFC